MDQHCYLLQSKKSDSHEPNFLILIKTLTCECPKLYSDYNCEKIRAFV